VSELHHRTCFFSSVFNFFHRSLQGDYEVMDSSVEVNHYKQSSGDVTNERLVKEDEKDLISVSFLKTKGNFVAQPISLVKVTGMH